MPGTDLQGIGFSRIPRDDDVLVVEAVNRHEILALGSRTHAILQIVEDQRFGAGRRVVGEHHVGLVDADSLDVSYTQTLHRNA